MNKDVVKKALDMIEYSAHAIRVEMEEVEPPTTNVIRVRTGEDVQKAVDSAPDGSLILVDPGKYRVSLILTKKNTKGVTIKSSADVSNFQARKNAFGYVDYEMRAAMPQFIPVSPLDYSIWGMDGSAGYTFENICIPSPQEDRGMIAVGTDQNRTLANAATNYRIKDCVLGSDQPDAKGHRGVDVNCGFIEIDGNFIGGLAEVARDSQAICGWNGPGPFKIHNNFLEASGENFLFGGATCRHPDLIPKNVVIEGNHIRKNPEWFNLPTQPAVKLLGEIKNVDGFLAQHNLLENCWKQGQTGYCFKITAANCGEKLPDGTGIRGQGDWVRARAIVIMFNVVRNCIGFMNVHNSEGEGKTQGVDGLHVAHNLAYAMNTQFLRAGGEPRGFLLNGGPQNIIIENNALFFEGKSNAFLSLATSIKTDVINVLSIERNIFCEGDYGIAGAGQAPGEPSLLAFSPNAVMRDNLIIKGGVRNLTYPMLNNVKIAGPVDQVWDVKTKTLKPAFTNYGPDMPALKEKVAF